MLKGSDILTV